MIPMKTALPLVLASGLLFVSSCDKPQAADGDQPAADGGGDRYQATDELVAAVSDNVSAFETIATIDHSRLAFEEGVTMPPSTLTIYSDPKVNAGLMALDSRVGLDLPMKILVFEEKGVPTVTYASSDFLAKRHGVSDAAALAAYEAATKAGLKGVDEKIIAPVDAEGVTKGYGIVEIAADFGHKESIQRLKEIVMKQGDTVWFGEIDLMAEVAAEGETIPPATLLLFGGPKPGGVAMAQFPQLGLDAFCQKLLVYEDESGSVRVIFNDIAAMAKLHYGSSVDAHTAIDGRLKKTFEAAVLKPAE